MTFSDIFKKFESVINLLLPVVAVFVPAVGLPALAIKIIPKLPNLMATAEELFTEVGQGSLKKDFVMSAASQLAAAYGDVATGGAAVSFEKEIAPNLSVLIDTAVAVANAISPGVVTESAASLAAATMAGGKDAA